MSETLLPPLHIKLGLMRSFTRAVNKEEWPLSEQDCLVMANYDVSENEKLLKKILLSSMKAKGTRHHNEEELEVVYKRLMNTERLNNTKPENNEVAINFYKAVCQDNWKGVQDILRTGKLSVEHRFQQRKTALLLAAERGQSLVVEYLISEAGACKEVVDNDQGMSALHWACQGGHYKVVRYLVNTARMNPANETSDGDTTLHIAARIGHLKIACFLVEECRLNIHSRNRNGWNAIHVAANEGYVHIVKYLIQKTRNSPLGVTNTGDTPLHLAAKKNYLDVVMFLVNSTNIDKNAKNNEGETAACLSVPGSAVKRFLS